MTRTDTRLMGRLLIAACMGCPALAAQLKTPMAANPAQTSVPGPSQAKSLPTQDQSQDQNQVQSRGSAQSQPETKTQPQTKPAGKRKQRSANSALPNTRPHAAPKRAASTPAEGAPKKVVVRHGGAEEPTAQIVTGMTPEEADRQRREAELLLSTTDERLKEIAPRPLDSRQQETVSQIHNYKEGSLLALKQGDVSRAHTLAQKAGLLAEDLASH
jgi:hypothetical protein